jgi:hypothetical protein
MALGMIIYPREKLYLFRPLSLIDGIVYDEDFSTLLGGQRLQLFPDQFRCEK